MATFLITYATQLKFQVLFELTMYMCLFGDHVYMPPLFK